MQESQCHAIIKILSSSCTCIQCQNYVRMRKAQLCLLHLPHTLYLRSAQSPQHLIIRHDHADSEMALRSWKQLVYTCKNLTCATQGVAVSFGKAARTCGSWRNILNEAHHSHMCRCHHLSAAATRLSGYRVRAIHSSSESEKVSYNYKLNHTRHHCFVLLP